MDFERVRLRGDHVPTWEMGLDERADLGLLKRRGEIIKSAIFNGVEPFLYIWQPADSDDPHFGHPAGGGCDYLMEHIAGGGAKDQIILVPFHRFGRTEFFDCGHESSRYQRVTKVTKNFVPQLEQQYTNRHNGFLVLKEIRAIGMFSDGESAAARRGYSLTLLAYMKKIQSKKLMVLIGFRELIN